MASDERIDGYLCLSIPGLSHDVTVACVRTTFGYLRYFAPPLKYLFIKKNNSALLSSSFYYNSN